MAEQVPAVGNILALIERGDWGGLTQHLAADIHWTTGAEEQLHGVDAVLRCLTQDPPPGPPAFHEVANGMLVRWIDKQG